jgi:hypothetical protein
VDSVDMPALARRLVRARCSAAGGERTAPTDPLLRWTKLAQRYSNARAQHRDERVAVNSRVVLASSRRQGGATHGQQRTFDARGNEIDKERAPRAPRARGAACDAARHA